MFGIVTGSVIVPVFVIDVRVAVNLPVPEMVPELVMVPGLSRMVPEFDMLPELMRILSMLSMVPPGLLSMVPSELLLMVRLLPLAMYPELSMVPEFDIMPELVKRTPEFIVRVIPDFTKTFPDTVVLAAIVQLEPTVQVPAVCGG